ncbi:MAG: hypothetical protein ACLRSW_05535 [Christensenellaceae bacterium]
MNETQCGRRAGSLYCDNTLEEAAVITREKADGTDIRSGQAKRTPAELGEVYVTYTAKDVNNLTSTRSHDQRARKRSWRSRQASACRQRIRYAAGLRDRAGLSVAVSPQMVPDAERLTGAMPVQARR